MRTRRAGSHGRPEDQEISMPNHTTTFTEEQDRLVRIDEVAARLSVSKRLCWKLLAAGRLPAPVRLGSAVRWRQRDIDAFIADGCSVAGGVR